MFDLATLDTTARADSGSKMQLRHPDTDEPLGPVFVLAGEDSAVHRKLEAGALDRLMARMRKGRKATPQTADELEREGVQTLAACTLGWTGVVLDGKEWPYSPENAVTLYTRFRWIREQAREFISDRSNYLRD